MATKASSAPIVALALLAGAILLVGAMWWRNQQVQPETPPTAGVDRVVKGLRLEDVYVVPAPGAASGTDEWSLVATLDTDPGFGGDRLLSVAIGGRPADLTQGSAAAPPSGIEVGATLLDVRPSPTAGQVAATAQGVPAEPGASVPAVLTFAERGPVRLAAPVWLSLDSPDT
jgi:hypothetical protein